MEAIELDMWVMESTFDTGIVPAAVVTAEESFPTRADFKYA